MMRGNSMAALAATVLVLALAGCGGDDGKSSSGPKPHGPTITIGTKNFTEQFILGELYRQALEANGFRVRLKSNIGSSEIVDRALVAGSLDMYPEYTGVALSELAGQTRRPSSRLDAYRRGEEVVGEGGVPPPGGEAGSRPHTPGRAPPARGSH